MTMTKLNQISQCLLALLTCILCVVLIGLFLSQLPYNEDWFNKQVAAILRDPTKNNKSLVNASEQSTIKINFTKLSLTPVQLNESMALEMAEKEHPNIVGTFWQKWKEWTNWFNVPSPPQDGLTYCYQVRLTDPYHVQHNNLIWQKFQAKINYTHITMHLLNAYYDNRDSNQTVVRIIAVNDQNLTNNAYKWWCLFWFDQTKSPLLVQALGNYKIWPDAFGLQFSGIYMVHLITCPVPAALANKVPQAVSLQAHGSCSQVEWQPSNILRVIYNKRENGQTNRSNTSHSIGVCVQALRFATYDISVRLVEWLEMLRLMDAQRVYLYVYSITDNMHKVLKHYEQMGFVDVRKLTLPGSQVNIKSLYNLYYSNSNGQFWPQEVLELNDCLYRSIYLHDYIAIIDVDEMILPRFGVNWTALICYAEKSLKPNDLPQIGYLTNRHALACEDQEKSEFFYQVNKVTHTVNIPKFLYMARHIYRKEPKPGHLNAKCFMRTAQVVAVHNHFPLLCRNSQTLYHDCTGMEFDPNVSLLMHYRRNDEGEKNNCTVDDRSSWPHFYALEKAVRQSLKAIFN